MKHVIWALGLSIMIVACAGATVPTSKPSGTEVPAAATHATSIPTTAPTRTSRATSTPAATPTAARTRTAEPTAVAWPQGITAHERSDQVLPYLEYVPPGYEDDDLKRPLLIFLHGAGEYGDGSEEQLSKVLSQGVPAMIANNTFPAFLSFVVLMPQYYFAPANGKCDVGDELDVFVQHAVANYRVDPRRIYMTGISCGGIAIFDYLSKERQYPIAAAVPIAAHPDYVMAQAGCELARTPTWNFHGALDEIIPIDFLEGRITELQACTDPKPTDLKLTVFPNGHHDVDTWDPIYDLSAGHDIYAWMRSHKAK
jgi:predicted peptidase